MSTENLAARPDERHTGAQLVVYLCFTEPAEGVFAERDLRPHLDEHKAWLSAIEASSQLLFAGPMLNDDYRYAGSGLLVLRAGSVGEAKAIADRDPFHAKGLRTYRIVPWQINEGSFDLHLSLSGLGFRIA